MGEHFTFKQLYSNTLWHCSNCTHVLTGQSNTLFRVFQSYLPQAALTHHTRITWVFHPLSNLNSSIYTLLCSIVWKPPLSFLRFCLPAETQMIWQTWPSACNLFNFIIAIKCKMFFSENNSYTCIIISWMLIPGGPDPKYWATGTESRMKCLCRWT